MGLFDWLFGGSDPWAATDKQAARYMQGNPNLLPEQAYDLVRPRPTRDINLPTDPGAATRSALAEVLSGDVTKRIREAANQGLQKAAKR